MSWATKVTDDSTTSEVLHTLEQVREAEEIASSEWDPDNNVVELLSPQKKGKLQEQKTSPMNLSPFLVYTDCTTNTVHQTYPFQHLLLERDDRFLNPD